MKSVSHSVAVSIAASLSWRKMQMLTLMTLVVLYSFGAMAQATLYGYDRPSNEMDFSLPPLPSLEESAPARSERDIEADLQRFFSGTAVLDDDLPKEAATEPAPTPKDAPKASAAATPKKVRRSPRYTRASFRKAPALPFQFKSVRLPDTIYKKAYNKPNRHLPVAQYEHDMKFDMIMQAKAGDVADMRALRNIGTPVHVRNPEGVPSLVAAAQHGQTDALHWLLVHGVNPNQMNAQGMTALHFAAYRGDKAMVDTLLAYGADIDMPDLRGVTPLSYAMLSHSAETVTFMRELGAGMQPPASRTTAASQIASSAGVAISQGPLQ